MTFYLRSRKRSLVFCASQAPERRPLVELKQTQRVCQKVEEISFLRKMTSNSTLWPQAVRFVAKRMLETHSKAYR